MRTTNLCLLLFGVYNINNVQTILINSLLFHNNSFYVSNLCAKLYRLAAASDKVYQLLAYGRWFSPDTPASSTIKTGHHDIAEILLKVVLSAINQIKLILGGFVYIVLRNWCISWVTVTLTHISAVDGVYCRDNIILQLSIKQISAQYSTDVSNVN